MDKQLRADILGATMTPPDELRKITHKLAVDIDYESHGAFGEAIVLAERMILEYMKEAYALGQQAGLKECLTALKMTPEELQAKIDEIDRSLGSQEKAGKS